MAVILLKESYCVVFVIWGPRRPGVIPSHVSNTGSEGRRPEWLTMMHRQVISQPKAGDGQQHPAGWSSWWACSVMPKLPSKGKECKECLGGVMRWGWNHASDWKVRQPCKNSNPGHYRDRGSMGSFVISLFESDVMHCLYLDSFLL